MHFNKNIYNVFNKFCHNVFIVNKLNDIKCSCIDYSTKKASPSCVKCLGLGTNIKIKKIKAVCKDKKSNFSMGNSFADSNASVYSTFYTEPNKLNEDDIIVDGNKVYTVFRIIKLYEEGGKDIYDKILAVDKKSDVIVFFNNFKKIVG